MSEKLQDVEPMVYRSRISVPYHWWAGDTASAFFIALRDEQKIVGIRCSECKRVFLPPRKMCPDCYRENSEWVELPPTGTLRSFTVSRRKLAAQHKEPPVIYGLIQVDGADTALLHILDEVKPEEVRIGMKVEARFAEERQGTVWDIAYFRPAS